MVTVFFHILPPKKGHIVIDISFLLYENYHFHNQYNFV